MVPPVPTPATKMSTLPSVSAQISGPVVAAMDSGVGRIGKLAGNKAVGGSFGQFLCLGDGAFHTKCAVGQHQFGAVGFEQVAAFHTHGFRHGKDHAVPRAAATADRPMPVLPEVGSMITESECSSPLASASSSIALAMRSLTLPAGLKYSSLATTVACKSLAVS